MWQRGTTGSVVGGPSYASADRWKLYVNASTTMTLSRQTFSPGQTEVPGNPKYYAKFDWLGTSSSQFFGFEQMIEGCHHAAGGYLTVSFYARTEQADDITLGVNQVFGSGGSASVTIGNFPVDTETTWKKFVVTMPVPSIAGKTVGADDTLAFTFYRSGTLNSYLEIANVQVEVGSVATPFEHRSYGEELALCQRYYQKLGGAAYTPLGSGMIFGNIVRGATVEYARTMRAVPSVISINNIMATDRSVYDNPIVSYSDSSAGIDKCSFNFNLTNSTSTNAYYAQICVKYGSVGYIEFDAEL